MSALNLGIVGYLNCFPLLYPLTRQNTLFANVVSGPPSELNKKFIEGNLDITPISSIEYARHAKDCLILPNVSIAADGSVLSILLISKYPIKELNNKTVALTSSSATSVALLKILLQLHFHVQPQYKTMQPKLEDMLKEADAALLIGDDALREGLGYQKAYVYDLGEIWKEMTGLPMVYALWVMKENFARNNSDAVAEVSQAMQQAKAWALNNKSTVLDAEQEKYDFSLTLLDKYFETIRYDFDERYQEAVLTYYTYANKCGLLGEVPSLKIWGTEYASTGNIR